MTEKNFGRLGQGYQMSLLKIIILDKKYGDTIIDYIEPNYFDNNSFKFIIQHVREYRDEYNTLPSFDALKQKILSETTNSTLVRSHIDTIDNIISHVIETGDAESIKKRAINFCRQQNLSKTLIDVEKIIKDGDFEEYNKIEKMIQNALQVGVVNTDVQDVFDDLNHVIRLDHREGIPTGVTGIDDVLKGGLAKGELGIILAPTGTGKTTFLTKIANTAFNENFNVVQIFFEDKIDNIKRKHYTLWSGIAPDDQALDREETIRLVNVAKSRSLGNIKLIKLPSDSVTISEIKSKLRKLIADGFNIDLLIIDYVDCIVSEKNSGGEEWKGEGSVMRGLESMCSEFDIAIWTATQGNRESITSEVVTTNQMGGSIKKAQVGHVVISIAKTLDQKEHNLGTITILKSRIGPDGIIFSNAKFDNEYLHIDTTSQNTLLGHKEDKEKEKKERIKRALENKARVQREIENANTL